MIYKNILILKSHTQTQELSRNCWIKRCNTFQGISVDELEQAFKDSVDEYLDFCIELGKTPEKSFSGKLILRLPPEIHERVAYQAQCNGVSLNAWLKQGIQHLLSAEYKPPQGKHA